MKHIFETAFIGLLCFYVPWNVMCSPWPAFAHKLIEAAFLDYARLLRSLGLREGAALWASRAGSAGEQLMEELFQGEGSVPETILGKEEVELGQESTEWPRRLAVWKGADDILFGAKQGSTIKSDFSNVTIVNSLCVSIPGKYDHHLLIVRRGDMRSFLHVKLSVRHWSLPVSVTIMGLTFLNVWYDQCVFVCVCVCM